MGLFLMAFAIAVGIYSVELSLYSRRGLGPGFISFWCAVLLGGMAIPLLVKGAVTSITSPAGTDGEGFYAVGAVVVLIALYAYFLETIGFVLCTFVAGWALYGLSKAMKWYVAMLLALVIAVGSYILFSTVLGVPLPKGVLTIAEG